MQHPYCYEGTEVLLNKEGITIAADLEGFERIMSAERILTLPRQASITAATYRAINKHILQDVYEWAGTYRTVDTGRGDAPFCLAAHIERNMTARFDAIAAEKCLKGLSDEDFARRAAVHVGELNAIHPFLEGNGRTNRAFLKILGRRAGKWIDLARIDPASWNEASRNSFLGADDAMTTVIAGLVAGPAENDPAIAVPTGMRRSRSASPLRRRRGSDRGPNP